ncbi:unnamed protein product [Allacma fusca]|uniref:Aldehyde dehydrogenase domain-containing protein n=1 Tax=Allacma fusca TaxID=39272 RepID=A0A8J2M871_9HEXA|nr:unnamed protein product [Allacma fusca]
MQGNTNATRKIGNIFETMVYNEEQIGDFSKILSWLAPQHNMITSIVNGKWTNSFRNKETFLIGNTAVGLGTATDELLEGILSSSSEESDSAEEVSNSTTRCTLQEKQERLETFKNLLDKMKTDLCLAESVATQVPAWQIDEYDQPTWKQEMSTINEIPSQTVMYRPGPRSENKLILIHLSRQGYSLRKILSTIFIPVIQFDGKFILAMNISSPQDSACALPIVYLTDALNKSKIRKAPIDLLLLDRFSKESWEIFNRKSNVCKTYIGGDWGPLSQLTLRLVSGVFTSAREVRGVHIIVDSSADVQTAVESISANVWSSGTTVNLRARTLLFVQQAIYKAVIESLQKKMNQLRIETSNSSSLKMTDFIKRSQVSIDSEEVLRQGAKVFAANGSDFTDATLVYDIGTSCNLIAAPRAGSGHILVVIPFRSTASSIKAENVWLNTSKTCGVSVPNDSYNVALLRETSGEGMLDLSGKKTENDVDSSAGQDKFLKLVQGAEKSQKSWQATTVSKRAAILENLLQSIFKNEPNIIEADYRAESLGDLIKVAGRIHTPGGLNTAEPLTVKNFQPVGLVGILLVNPNTMNIQTRVMPLVMSAVKGNVSIVMSVSTADSDNSLAAIEKACATDLPPDGEESSLQADQFPMSAFNRIIIDTELGSRIPFINRSQYLEIPKTICISFKLSTMPCVPLSGLDRNKGPTDKLEKKYKSHVFMDFTRPWGSVCMHIHMFERMYA